MRSTSAGLLLGAILTGCGGAPEPSILDPRFDDLTITSDLPVDADLNEDGNITALTGRFAPLASGDPLDEVTAFVSRWREELAVGDAQIVPIEVRPGIGDSSVAWFGVENQGLTVFDAFVVGEVSPPHGVTGLITQIPADLDLRRTEPRVPGEVAADTGQAYDHPDIEDATVVGDPVLGIFNGGLYLGEPTPSVLAWLVPLVDADVWVDATVGDVIWVDPSNHDVDLELYDAKNSRNRAALVGYDPNTTPTRELWMDEAGPVGAARPSPVARRAHDAILATHEFFEDGFGYTSIDGAGIFPLEVYVHYGPRGLRNASFNRTLQSLWLGDGATYLDVVAHEFTHGVIYNTAGLRYQAYSGALNESIADSFGAFVDDGEKWKLGEDIERGPLRRLDYPGRKGDPDHWDRRNKIRWRGTCRDAEPRCDGGRTCVAGKCADLTDDKGFVHSNSGIANKATWLMAADRDRVRRHDRVKVRSIGQRKASSVMMDVVQLYLGPSSGFQRYARAMVMACKRAASFENDADVNPAGLEAKDCGAMLNAMHAVGIHDGPDKDEDGYLDRIDRCPDDYDPEQTDTDRDGVGDACDDLVGANITVELRHDHPDDEDPIHVVIADAPMTRSENRVRPGRSRTRQYVVEGEFFASIGRGGTVFSTTECGLAREGGTYVAVYHAGFGLNYGSVTCWRTGPGNEPRSPLENE